MVSRIIEFFREKLVNPAEACRARLSIDSRSLAFVRISCGGFAALTSLQRLGELSAHYTDAGCLPRSTRLAEMAELSYQGWWSLGFLDGSAAWNGALLVLAILSGVAVALGWRTRVATILCWVLVASLRARIPYVADGGDNMLRIFLFWGIFLPWGRDWSLDASRERRAGFDSLPPATIFSGGTAAVLIQFCLVYWMSAIFKYNSTWRTDGTALADALAIKSLARPIADWLLGFPSILLKSMNHAVLLIEEVGPIFAIAFPLKSRWRLYGALSVMMLHAGIAVVFNLGTFPWIAIFAWPLFFPPWVWDRIEEGVRSKFGRESGGENNLSREEIAFAGGRQYRFLMNWLPIGILFLVIWWNLTNLPLKGGRIPMPQAVRWTGFALHLNQHWGFFAPDINTRDGWYVTTATLADGSRVDPWRNGSPVSWEKPDSFLRSYRNKRWREYMLHMFHYRKPYLINDFASWLERDWSRGHPDNSIENLEIYFMLRDSRHPEDGTSKVQVYPIEKISEYDQVVYPGDTRRNEEDAQREAEAQAAQHPPEGSL